MRLAQVFVQRSNAGKRQRPGFLVVGAMRSGTSSLFKYLAAHPDVRRSARKETDYFSSPAWEFGLDWYLAHFPLRRRGGVAFEACPQYLLHPLAAERAATVVPDARIVVSLRDPAARLLSHHRFMTRIGLERLPLEDALRAEAERTDRIYERCLAGHPVDSRRLNWFSYERRSTYAPQLERWMAHFDDLVFFDFDRFRGDPEPEWQRLLAGLGLDQWQPDEFRNFTPGARNTGADEAWDLLPADVAERLRADWEVAQRLVAEAAPPAPS